MKLNFEKSLYEIGKAEAICRKSSLIISNDSIFIQVFQL